MRFRRFPILVVSVMVCATIFLIARFTQTSGAPGVGNGIGIAALVVALGVVLLRWVGVWRARKRFEKFAHVAAVVCDQKRYSEALHVCDAALIIAKKLKFRADDVMAIVFLVRSASLQKLGRKDDALEAAAQAFACLCRVRDAEIQIDILDQMGALLLDCEQARRAIPILEAAVGLGQAVENRSRRTCYRLQQVGLAYLRVGLNANSVAAFGKAIEIMTKEKGADTVALSSPFVNLGNGYKRMQKLEDAERCYRESLRLLEVNDAKTPEQLSLVLMNMGVVCAESGRNEEADGYYRRVLELRTGVYGRNDWRMGTTYNNLALCRQRARDFGAAEEYVEKAMEILEDRPESLCHAIDTLSRIREDQGRMEEALGAASRAREVQQNRQTPDLSHLATLLEREAELAARTGVEEQSGDCRKRAQQIRQALDAAPPADRDLTNVPDALKTLDQHLQSSMAYVKTLQEAGS